MTVKECYEVMGGNYEEVMGRLMKEERVIKYLGKFAAGNDYEVITAKIAEEDWKEAFRAVHSLKGVALNLSITALAQASSVLCEVLRPEVKPTVDITGMLSDIKQQYDRALECIAVLLGQGQ